MIELRSRFDVDDAALSTLHGLVFGASEPAASWSARLARFSVSWVGAFDGVDLVGFVNAVGDGGQHAFLLDTAVHPDYQRRGIGRALVERLAVDASAAGCEWLHVDYESPLGSFYGDACGFAPTAAGVMRLSASH